MNKYLEKTARYFYREAKHFADHARDMGNIGKDMFNFRFSRSSYGYAGEGEHAYRNIFTRRSQGIVDKAGVRGAKTGATMGASVGGISGYSSDQKVRGEDGKLHKRTTSDRLTGGLKGAVTGGVIGGVFGHHLGRQGAKNTIWNRKWKASDNLKHSRGDRFQANESKFKKEWNTADQADKARKSEQRKRQNDAWDEDFKRRSEESRRQHNEWRENFNKKYGSSGSGSSSGYNSGSGSRGFRSSSGTIDQIHKDLEFPAGGFTTKTDATKHFRRMAAKHHPDKGGSTEKMQKINKAWDDYKKHPNGFEKLAGLGILEKVAHYL